MGGDFKFYTKTDKRQKIKTYKLNEYFYGKGLEWAYKVFKYEEEIKFWAGNIPFDPLLYLVLLNRKNKNNKYIVEFFTTNSEAQNFFTFTFDYVYYYRFLLILRLKYNDVFFPIDTCFYKTEKTSNFVTGISSYFTNTCYRLVFSIDNTKNNINFISISNIYSSFTWVERELSELNNITFVNLKDGRRLLTDYTTLNINNDDYKTTSYNLAVENLYNKMLHWMHIFSFFLSCAIMSFIVYNKNLISLLLVSEIILLILFFLTIVVASFYNINFLLSFSFFLLIFAGLELALNLLLLML